MPSDSEPGLPPPLPPPIAAGSSPVEGRLHPYTLLFAVWGVAKGFLIPAIILIAVGRERSVGWFLLLFVVIPFTLALIRYFTFSYRITDGELKIRHGVLQRTERNIPLDRVQDIRLEQGVLHRILGMADVHVETAGGQGPEASLSVLAKSEAERLRLAVFEQVARNRAATGPAPAGAAPTTPSPPDASPEVLRALGWWDLVRAGITSNRAASTIALLLIGVNFIDDVLGQDKYNRWIEGGARHLERWVSTGGGVHWIHVALGVTALIFISMVFSVVGSILTFHGFRLARRGEDLHRSYGLLTRRSSSLPRKRIQVLKVEETLLRRMLGLATLRVDTAGGHGPKETEEQSGRDVLVPVLPNAEVDALLPAVFPDLDREPPAWRQVSRRAIRRGTLKAGLVLLLLATLLVAFRPSWGSLWPVLGLPLAYAINRLTYRHLGFAVGAHFFRTRRGWLSRATHIVPIRNAQSVVLRQSPFDRRHGVSTLAVDTAGQTNTGGGPQIHNVPWDDALAAARDIARHAADTRYRVGR